MNLTFGNLASLKAWLLPETWQSETQKDGIIAALGLGVAGAMETFCNRKLGRASAEETFFPADEAVLHLARYPLEEKPAAAVRLGTGTTFEAVTDAITQWRADIGQVMFNGAVGTHEDLLRITATGGFWIDDSEDNDGEMPEGATAMPKALVSAWQIQCRHLWTSLKLFANTGESGEAQNAHLLGGFDLMPVVKSMLNPYRRFTL